jgi:hypothetical protein
MALTDNLVAFWELEEASGNRTDAVASIVLTDVNTVTSAAGIVGTAASFNQVSAESLTVADNAALSMGNIDFTIQAWVRFIDVASTHVVICKGAAVNSTLEYALYGDSSPDLVFRIDDGSATLPTVRKTNISDSTWYHVIAYHDSVNNLIGIIVNDGTPATTATSIGSQDTAQVFTIGDDGNSRWHHGLIDQVGIWKRVLSAGEITQLYNAGSGLSYAAMAGGGGGANHNALSLLGVG